MATTSPWQVGTEEARTALGMCAAAARGDHDGWMELLTSSDPIRLITAFSGLARALATLLSGATGLSEEAMYRLLLAGWVKVEAEGPRP